MSMRTAAPRLWVVSMAAMALCAGAALAADPKDEPRPHEWLARMNDALTKGNYDGTFFHVRQSGVETLRIIHRVQDGETRERLVSLDGSGREFIRDGNELVCYLPDQRTVLVERRPQEGPLLGNLPRFDESLAASYEVKSSERARLMGRDTRLVVVHPRDDYRYGYRLWIDEKTAMPLKTQLCDARGNVIEQVVFSSLTMRSQIPDAAFKPDVQADGFRWVRQDPRSVNEASTPILWSAIRLPPGFRMASRSKQTMPGAAAPVAHLVFTDGVASVSVFVESRAESQSTPAGATLSGAAQMGSSSAFSTTIDGHQVTAVGEVPPQTVRFIASQVKAEAPRAVSRPPAPRRFAPPVPGSIPEKSPGPAPAFAPRDPPR